MNNMNKRMSIMMIIMVITIIKIMRIIKFLTIAVFGRAAKFRALPDSEPYLGSFLSISTDRPSSLSLLLFPYSNQLWIKLAIDRTEEFRSINTLARVPSKMYSPSSITILKSSE